MRERILGTFELLILIAARNVAPQSVSQIVARVSKAVGRNVAHGSVSTSVARLREKGMLVRVFYNPEGKKRQIKLYLTTGKGCRAIDRVKAAFAALESAPRH